MQMNNEALPLRITDWLRQLTVEIGPRHPGSEGNGRATEFYEEILRETGLEAESTEFECIDWRGGQAM
jgi:aminopeptidase YwaD